MMPGTPARSSTFQAIEERKIEEIIAFSEKLPGMKPSIAEFLPPKPISDPSLPSTTVVCRPPVRPPGSVAPTSQKWREVKCD